jgi:hypothetical protein
MEQFSPGYGDPLVNFPGHYWKECGWRGFRAEAFVKNESTGKNKKNCLLNHIMLKVKIQDQKAGEGCWMMDGSDGMELANVLEELFWGSAIHAEPGMNI